MNSEQETHLWHIAGVIQGQCPIHGLGMVLVRSDEPGWEPSLLSCPRMDCAITVKHFKSGTLELAPEFQHLLAAER